MNALDQLEHTTSDLQAEVLQLRDRAADVATLAMLLKAQLQRAREVAKLVRLEERERCAVIAAGWSADAAAAIRKPD